VVAVEIDLVGAHDAHHSLGSRTIGVTNRRSEKCSRLRLPRPWSFRIHYFGGFDSLGEKANPPIDLSQPSLAVLIVGVFTAIAVAGSPRYDLHNGRTFSGEQKLVLVLEALQSVRRYVVFDCVAGSSACGLLVNPFRISWFFLVSVPMNEYER